MRLKHEERGPIFRTCAEWSGPSGRSDHDGGHVAAALHEHEGGWKAGILSETRVDLVLDDDILESIDRLAAGGPGRVIGLPVTGLRSGTPLHALVHPVDIARAGGSRVPGEDPGRRSVPSATAGDAGVGAGPGPSIPHGTIERHGGAVALDGEVAEVAASTIRPPIGGGRG